ncbi:vanadium-dependent haloperoxidase [Cellulophaga tyrosinoxydans]|nr:vanadium-dependent haloperoxidase [Cellulophaga tyrosinoxydans]
MRKIFHLTMVILLTFIVACSDNDTMFFQDSESASAESYEGKFLQDYFYLTCRIVQTTNGFFPTQASRAYGYIGLASYEAVVNGIDASKTMAGQISGLKYGDLPFPDTDLEYNWAISCNAATAEMMRKMFGVNITTENLQRINSMEVDNLNKLETNVSEDIKERSISFGLSIAQALYQLSTTDGGHEAYLDPFSQGKYQMPTDDFCWTPTGATAYPLSPFWSKNRSFVDGIVATSQPAAHVTFSTNVDSEFYNQAMGTYEQVMNNTPEQEEIARYWADDPFATCTPAGHTFNILTQLLQESNATLAKSAVGFGMMAIAENDAFISCWKTKYDFVLIRPVSYIQKYIDPNFQTVIGTPPFPAYTSGHSAEIGSGIKVLMSLFSDSSGDYKFTDLSQIQFGYEARTYDNFYEMADECAKSRFYGGIHYEMDNTKGLEIGYAVGDAVVNDLNWPKNSR